MNSDRNRQKRLLSGSKLRAAVLMAAVCGVADTSHASNLYWDPTNGAAAGTGSATPGGNWDGVTSSWNDHADGGALGTIAPFVPGSTAVFSAGADATGSFTVTVGGTQTVGGINIEEGNVTLAGVGTIDMGATGIALDTAATTKLSSAALLTGAGARLTKTGAGTLVIATALNQPNSFDAGVTVNGGVLEFPGENSATAGASNPLGKAPASVISDYIQLGNGGILRSTRVSAGATSFVLPNRGIVLGPGGGTLEMTDPSAVNSLLVVAPISGSGSLTKTGAGTLQLQGAKTYSGDTFVVQGFLGLNGTATLGSGAGTLHLDGGGLAAFASRGATPIPNPIVMTADTIIRNSTAAAANFNIPISSTSITATSGTLTIRNVATSTAGTLAVRFLGDSFNFTRPIVIDQGTANVATRLTSITDIAANTTTFSGVISGNGIVQRTSAGDGTGGKTELSAANTYSGGTEINGGYIGLASDSVGAPGAVTSGPVGTGAVTFGAAGSTDDPTVGFYAAGGPRTIANGVNIAVMTHVTFLGSNALTLSGPVNLGSTSRLLTANGALPVTFSNTVSGNAGVGFTKDGTGTLVLSGANSYSGQTLVNDGKLVIAQSHNTSPVVAVQNAATLELATSGNGMTVLKTGGLQVGASARIDVQNNKIITGDPVGVWTGSNYTDTTALIRAGRNGGNWSGSGIVTSQTSATQSILTSIGIASAQQAKSLANAGDTAVWAGQTVTGSETVVMYTYGGDANLDGKVDISDYGRIDFNIPLGVNGWYNGDFNYDGKIDISDYGIIDFNIGIQGAQLPTADLAATGSREAAGDRVARPGGVTTVPEPLTALALLTFGGAAYIRRRRRR